MDSPHSLDELKALADEMGLTGDERRAFLEDAEPPALPKSAAPKKQTASKAPVAKTATEPAQKSVAVTKPTEPAKAAPKVPEKVKPDDLFLEPPQMDVPAWQREMEEGPSGFTRRMSTASEPAAYSLFAPPTPTPAPKPAPKVEPVKPVSAAPKPPPAPVAEAPKAPVVPVKPDALLPVDTLIQKALSLNYAQKDINDILKMPNGPQLLSKAIEASEKPGVR